MRGGDGPRLSDAALRGRKVPGNRSPFLLQSSGAGAPRRIPRPDCLPSFFGVPSARQRLYTLDLFARFLVDGGVPEVDVPVQARVGVVLFVAVRLRYSGGVHRVTAFLWARSRGVATPAGPFLYPTPKSYHNITIYVYFITKIAL